MDGSDEALLVGGVLSMVLSQEGVGTPAFASKKTVDDSAMRVPVAKPR